MKIKYFDFFLLVFFLILCSCSDKDSDDVIYYPYGTIGVNGVVFDIEEDHAIVINSSRLGDLEDIRIVSEIKKDGKVYPVTKIKDNAFLSKNIKKLTIPSSIKEIEALAFKGTNVEELYIDDLKSWCEIDFKEDRNYSPLTDTSWYQSFANPIGENTSLYVGGQLLGDILILENIERVKMYAFKNLKFDKIIIGKGVRNIEEKAFYNNGAREIVLGEDLKAIGSAAFAGSYVEELVIPDYLSDLKVSMAAFGTGINRVVVPDFNFWIDMESRTGIIGAYYTREARSIDMTSRKSNYDLVINGEILKKAVIPGRIKTLTKFGMAFSSVTEIIFEEGVEDLNEFSLYRCNSLRNVKLPSTIKRLDGTTFYGSNEIESIEIENPIPPEIYYNDYFCELNYGFEVYEDAFWEGCELIVPQESVELYKTTYPWSEFKNIRGK